MLNEASLTDVMEPVGAIFLSRTALKEKLFHSGGLMHSLERWFIEAYRHAHQWEVVDGWWDKQGSNEIDLVAVDTSKKIIEFAEVKLNPQKYDDRRLHMKAAAFLEKHSKFKSYDITIRGLSPEDI